jgi:alpha-beta hydrolase superfamily lysophospholipase
MEVKSNHNYILDVRKYKSQTIPKAKVLICHGFGIYKERYEKLIEQLQSNGYEVWAYDHCGHGLSSGDFYSITKGKQLGDDFHAVLTYFLDKGHQGKTFVYAHSMGGNIVARYFLDHEVKCNGIVLSAPMLGLQMNRALMKLGLMKKAFESGFDISTWINTPKILSSDKHILQEFLSDNDIQTDMSFSLLFSLLKNGEYLTKNEIRMPLMLLWGDKDQFVNLKKLEEFAELNGLSPLVLNDVHHEPFCEPNSKLLHQPVIDWMNSRL